MNTEHLVSPFMNSVPHTDSVINHMNQMHHSTANLLSAPQVHPSHPQLHLNQNMLHANQMPVHSMSNQMPVHSTSQLTMHTAPDLYTSNHMHNPFQQAMMKEPLKQEGILQVPVSTMQNPGTSSSSTEPAAQKPKRFQRLKAKGTKRRLRKQPQMSKSKKAKMAKLNQKVSDKGSHKNIDTLLMALEMGYTDMGDKSGEGEGTSDGMTMSSNQDDDDSGPKLSPEENIQQVTEYKASCSCSCMKTLTVDDLATHRLEVASLDRQSRDFFIMGLFRGSAGATSVTSKKRDRKRFRFTYRMFNMRICQVCFQFVNNIGEKYLRNLKKHFTEVGIKSRTHGNIGRKPTHALQSDIVDEATDFIFRYAEHHGVPAARPPKNAKSKRTIRLPPTDSVTSVYKQYKEMCDFTGKRVIADSTFRKIWSTHAAHIKVAKQNLPKESTNTQGQASTSQNRMDHTNPDSSQQTQRPNMKKTLKSKMKEVMQPTMPKNPPNMQTVPPHHMHNDGLGNHPHVNVPFDFSPVDMSRASLMPLSRQVHMNDQSNDSVDTSWQHNLLLPPHSHMTHIHQAPHMIASMAGMLPGQTRMNTNPP